MDIQVKVFLWVYIFVFLEYVKGTGAHPPEGRQQKQEELQFVPVEQKPQSQKDGQDEKTEGYVPDEGTR